MNVAPGAPSKTARSKEQGRGRNGGDSEGGMKITGGGGGGGGGAGSATRQKVHSRVEQKLLVDGAI